MKGGFWALLPYHADLHIARASRYCLLSFGFSMLPSFHMHICEFHLTYCAQKIVILHCLLSLGPWGSLWTHQTAATFSFIPCFHFSSLPCLITHVNFSNALVKLWSGKTMLFKLQSCLITVYAIRTHLVDFWRNRSYWLLWTHFRWNLCMCSLKGSEKLGWVCATEVVHNLLSLCGSVWNRQETACEYKIREHE